VLYEILSTLLEWLAENVFTFKPITSVTVPELFSLYFTYFAVALLVAFPFMLIDKRRREPPTLGEIIIGSVLEELFFRGLPLHLFGSNGAVYGTIIWSLLHYHHLGSIAFAMVFGILLARLWIGGLWLEAVFLHMFHGTLCLAVGKYLKERRTFLTR